MITITESEMNFGPYKQDDVFYIEKSKIYGDITKNVKIAEFLLKKDTTLIFIEAKSSVRNPKGENPEKFSIYIDKIAEKFNNSLDILLSAMLNRLSDENNELSQFTIEDLSNLDLTFCLVVKNAKKEYLLPVTFALKRKLSSKITIWKVRINVINEDLA